MNAVEQTISEMTIMDDKDSCFIVKGNVLLNRLKTVTKKHDQLMAHTDQYDPVGFYNLVEKMMPKASKLSSMELNNGPISDAPAPQHHYELPPLEIPTFDGDYTK